MLNEAWLHTKSPPNYKFLDKFPKLKSPANIPIHVYVLHYLIRQLILHFFLQPPQQKWTQYFVETSYDEDLLFLIQLDLVN